MCTKFVILKALAWRCSVKTMFWKNSQAQESTCDDRNFLKQLQTRLLRPAKLEIKTVFLVMRQCLSISNLFLKNIKVKRRQCPDYLIEAYNIVERRLNLIAERRLIAKSSLFWLILLG